MPVKDLAAINGVADAIRRLRAEQLELTKDEALLPWAKLRDQDRAVWLEQAYAAVDAWQTKRPPKR